MRARLIFARVALVAVLANIGLGVVCDMTCAASTLQSQAVATVMTGHGGHCPEGARSTSHVGAGSSDAACRHGIEVASPVAEGRALHRSDVIAASAAHAAPATNVSIPFLVRGDASPPPFLRPHRSIVLRI